MPLYDVKCLKCGALGECFFESSDPNRVAQCSCGGYAHIEWRGFGGMMGKNKGIYPHHDVQLGMTIESSQHRDRVAKERGLAVLGPDEFRRSMNNQHEPEPSMIGHPQVIEAMEKAYYEISNGLVPIEPPKQLDLSKGEPMITGRVTD